jgi:putative transposase
MPRTARAAPPGFVYHVLNRAVARLPLFQKDGDYDAFERVLAEALIVHPTRLLAYCLMPNHWHLVLWPERCGELTAFTRWLTHTHTMRWHTHYHTVGTGHLYQGRFKSFPIAQDEHLYRVLRYVERNALRANLVARAEEWRWSSLWRRSHPDREPAIALADWPVRMPDDWVDHVNQPETDAELAVLRRSLCRGTPFGGPVWQKEIARRLRIQFTLRPPGRPKKEGNK